MRYDKDSVQPPVYVDPNIVVMGKGPTRWVASTCPVHGEMFGAATYGALRNLELSGSEPSPEPTIVQYEKCESTDQGALQVVGDEMEPVPAGKIKISVVKAGGLTDVVVGDYVRAID